jgi:hypothetical protein
MTCIEYSNQQQKYTIFSSIHEIVTKTDHTLVHKINHSKLKNIQDIQTCALIKLEDSRRKALENPHIFGN